MRIRIALFAVDGPQQGHIISDLFGVVGYLDASFTQFRLILPVDMKAEFGAPYADDRSGCLNFEGSPPVPEKTKGIKLGPSFQHGKNRRLAPSGSVINIGVHTELRICTQLDHVFSRKIDLAPGFFQCINGVFLINNIPLPAEKGYPCISVDDNDMTLQGLNLSRFLGRRCDEVILDVESL